MALKKNNSEFAKRLDVFISKHHKSRSKFCEHIDFSVSTVGGYFSRGTKPGYDFFNKFLEVYSSEDLIWLIKGRLSVGVVMKDISVVEGCGESKTEKEPYENLMNALKQVLQHEGHRQ